MKKEINYDLTTDEINEKFKSLFECYVGEDGGYYKNGQVLRGYELGDDSSWKRHVIDMLESLKWLETNNTCRLNPNFNPDIEESADNKKYIHDTPNKIQIFQIKEKFGEIRIYVTIDNLLAQDSLTRIVTRCETLCNITCTYCGTLQHPLKQYGRAWVGFVCDECFDKQIEANKKYKESKE